MEPCAIIDQRLPEICIKNLHLEGFKTFKTPLTDLVEAPLAGHPDIQMFIHEKNIFVHPDIDRSFLKNIEIYANVIICSSKLNISYPGDIPYNIACTGKTALHRKDSTDECILKYFLQNNIEIINIKQGYTKCSTLIVDDSSIVTADRSIYDAAENKGLNSMLITHGYIDLPGYNYGFIGGASGIFHDTVYLTGSINHHPDFERITHFIESRGMHLKILSDKKIFDAGSIFFIG